ncbi:unnamed protein product [Pylaiella littoralis]
MILFHSAGFPSDQRPAIITRKSSRSTNMIVLVLLAAAAMVSPSLGFAALPSAASAAPSPTTAASAAAARWHSSGSSSRFGSTPRFVPSASTRISAPATTTIATATAGARPDRQPAAAAIMSGGWIKFHPVILRSHYVDSQGGGGGGGRAAAEPYTSTSMMASPLPDTPNTPPKVEELRTALVYGESTTRSFVKALAWRLTAGVVTLVSGLVFSGSLATAMSIVGSDFVTKSGFMFAGERLWNRVKWGQDKTGDSAKRSLAKAVLWRVFAASNTLICGVFLAKDLSVASKIAGTDTIFKTALFFLNERMWTKINWGKEYEPEYYL